MTLESFKPRLRTSERVPAAGAFADAARGGGRAQPAGELTPLPAHGRLTTSLHPASPIPPCQPKLQGGQAAGNLLANDLRILSSALGAEEAKTVNSEAEAWFQKHQTPLQFVYKDGENWQQFPLFAIEYPEGDDHAGRIVARPPS